MTATAVRIIPTMGTRKNDPLKRGRPATGKTPTTTVYARVRPELGKALDAYLADQRPEPTVTRVVETALEDFLEAKGYWPPPEPSE